MSRSSLVKKHQFDETSQWMNHVDPASIRLHGDRVLLQDLPGSERVGSIWLPGVCQDQEILRWGIVIAVGPGDNCIEYVADQYKMDSDGRPYLKRRSVKCKACGGRGKRPHREYGVPLRCWTCGGNGIGRLPMSVKPGDRVLYSQRQEAEIWVNGTKYAMVHCEQAIYGVATGGTVAPLLDRLLVNRDAIRQRTDSGLLFLPPSSIEERPEGQVVSVGPGRLLLDGSRVPMEVKVGDHVMFSKYGGSDFKLGGDRFLVMCEADVLGVLG